MASIDFIQRRAFGSPF